MTNDFKAINISIKNLSLWDENPRFPEGYFDKTEKELIEYFFSKKDFKLIEFATEVVQEFDLPQLEKLVIYENDGRNIVLEGNRRLAVYKLLENPELIENEETQNKFKELKNEVNINNDFELECVVTQDKNQGLRYIDRKHLRGNNEVSWGDNERAHHNARRGNAKKSELLKVAITKRIKDLDFPEELKEQILGRGFVTTLWRLTAQNSAWSVFGFSFDDNDELQIKDEEFDEKLKVIIFDVLQNGKFNNKLFSRLKKEEIESYLRQITNQRYQQVNNEIKKQAEEIKKRKEQSLFPGLEKPRSEPRSSLRTYLIRPECVLRIKEPKINNIYCELKNDLSLNKTPNAVGVLFRVFLEISLDFYARKKGFEFENQATISQKIPRVVEDLIKKGHDKKEFNNINRVGSSDKNKSYLSIQNFHEYVHSTTTQPNGSELRTMWENLENFFQILWNEINNSERNEKRK